MAIISLKFSCYMAYMVLFLNNFNPISSEMLITRVAPALQRILNQAYNYPLYTYPTSFTQRILPKSIHSHNDYDQPVPFYSALSVGAISIEADIIHLNDTLYVGHELTGITNARTLENLYIKPLLDALDRQNPPHPSLPSMKGSDEIHGVYDKNHRQTLYFILDIKTDGPTTWPAVVKAFHPLRMKGYLSSIDGKEFKRGAVTVVGTGNTPVDLIEAAEQRDCFYEAPIQLLNNTKITRLVSPIAQASFTKEFGELTEVGMNKNQIDLLRTQLLMVHDKGMMMRYYNIPEWPVVTRNTIWRQLRTEGLDLLNVDNLEAAAGYEDHW